MNYIRILKNKVFRLLFASIILTNLANSISSISLIWIAYNKFNSPLVIAIVLGALQFPNIILGPFLGGLLDKFNKIKLMIFANVINSSVFLFLIFNPLTSRIDLSVFILLLVLSGSMKPLLVGGDSMVIQDIFESNGERMSANALVIMSFDTTYIFGSLLSGLILALGYGFKVYALVTIFYMVIAIILFRINTIFTPKHINHEKNKDVSYISNTKSAFKTIFKNKQLIAVLSMDFFWNMLLWAGLTVLLPVLVKTVLNSGSEKYGLLESMTSIGIIIGSFFVGKIKLKENWLIKGVVITIGIHGLLFSVIGLIKNIWLICILLILIGFIVSPALIYKTTFYQKAFDEKSKGALFTIAGSMTSSSYPLGIMVTSLLATFKNGIAIPYVFLFYGLIIVILSIIVYRNVLLKSQ